VEFLMVDRREFRSHDTLNDAYVWGLLEHANSLISRARELELAQYGITMEQMSVLHALLICGGSATLDEIAAIIVRQHNSVSTLISRMSRSGLVDREKQPQQKKYNIQITQKARDIVDAVPRRSIEIFLNGLTLKEKDQFATYLEKLITTGHEVLGHNRKLPFLT
jgi:DNA-binding MarR family transcriptional regulator